MISGSEQAATPTVVGLHDVAKVVLRIIEVCGVCSTAHVAKLYAHTTRPQHRAWVVLEHLRQLDYIESHRPSMNEPAVHRFTKRIRTQYKLPLVRWNSKLRHRLAVADVYMALGMPQDFIAECRLPFVWRGEEHVLSPDAYTMGMFVEVQRTHITSKRWSLKRRLYEVYFGSGLWQRDFDTKPDVVVLDANNQQPETVGLGIGYRLHVVSDIRQMLPRNAKEPPQK